MVTTSLKKVLLLMSEKMFTTRQIAFVVVMSALANVLGYLSIPLGTTKIHFIQLPIILSGLTLGSLAGGVVGFIGSTMMALTLPKPNFFILPGNAMLGFFTGIFYFRLKKVKPPIIPQFLSVIGAIIIQFPYTYVSDVYLMSMPSSLVLFTILPKLLLEDIISLLIAHVILFRVDIASLLKK